MGYESIREDIRPLLENLLELGRMGYLTRSRLNDIVRDIRRKSLIQFNLVQTIYKKENSWAIYSREYIENLSQIFHGKVVLEVFSGGGLLAHLMQQRGIDWIPTDSMGTDWKSNKSFTEVLSIDAVSAVNDIKAHAVFASWAPWRKTLDAEVAEACVKKGIPFYIIAEPLGGCTGSSELWLKSSSSYGTDEFPLWDIERVFDDGDDVLSWPNTCDKTYVITPATFE